MRHHFEELRSAKRIIGKNEEVLLAVDDNFKTLGIGKGKYIMEWAKSTHQEVLLDGYQIILRTKASDVQKL